MKVVQVLYSLDLGGIEEYAVNLGEYFANEGIESVILLLSKARDKKWSVAKVEKVRSSGIDLIDISDNGKIGKMVELNRTLHRLRANFVIIHHERNTIRVLPAKLSGGFRLIQVQHNTVFRPQLKNRFVNGLVDRFVSPSGDVRKVLIEEARIPEDKIKLIENGINLKEYSAVKKKKDRITILAAGRFVEQKNFVELAGLFRKLIDGEIEQSYDIVWAGEGETWDSVRESCREYKEISFPGSVMDMKSLYAKADIYVSYSIYEGLSLTLLEAMASGCAVVSTRTGGTSEAIENGQSGILVDVGDSRAFLHELGTLIQDRERISELGRNAATAVRRYDFANTCRSFVQMMEEQSDERK